MLKCSRFGGTDCATTLGITDGKGLPRPDGLAMTFFLSLRGVPQVAGRRSNLTICGIAILQKCGIAMTKTGFFSAHSNLRDRGLKTSSTTSNFLTSLHSFVLQQTQFVSALSHLKKLLL